MPDAPRLDPRTWEDLRRELIRRVPMHAPEWTDLGPADPGVALLELFAWLGEHLLRRMDQVPADTEAAFVRLLGLTRRPASCASVWLALSPPKDKPHVPVVVQFSPNVPRALVAAGPVEFQITSEINVLPVESIAALRRVVDSGLSQPEIEALEAIAGDHLKKPVTDVTAVFYETARLQEPKGGKLGEPVHLAATADHALWIALIAPEPAFKQVGESLDALRKQLYGRVLSVGVVVDGTLERGFQQVPAGGAAVPTPEVSWQISTGEFIDSNRRTVDGLRYQQLSATSDGSAGLTRTGVIRLQLPGSGIGTWSLKDGEDRALDGMGDLPPALDDPKLEERILGWVRAFRIGEIREIGEQHPAVIWATVNVVEAEQAVTQLPELIGRGTGEPGQTVTLSRSPVLPESVLIEVREAGAVGWLLWSRVADLAASRGDDPHYTLDPATGVLGFGDGIHGRMPRRSEAIRVRAWRTGGGAVGNVPANTIHTVKKSPPGFERVIVNNPLAATGGRDAETEAEARARVPTALRNQDRAVAPSDFRELALLTPGLTLGRAEVIPLHKPDDRGVIVAGAITVIVVPAYDPVHPDEPVPDREAVRRVIEWLEPRRLVTTELYVAAPVYVPCWMSVAIEVSDGFGLATVRHWVELALRQHFAPLPPYGPSGQGWPFGRPVSRDDVIAAALSVRGVRLVRDAQLSPTVVVPIERWQLPVIRGVTVVSGDTAPDPTLTAPAPPRVDGTLVAVPVVRERC